jgi:Tol biopolymer transport system component
MDRKSGLTEIFSDEMRIAFASNRKGPYNLYVKSSSSNSGPEETLLETPTTKIPQDWSKDDRFLLYLEINEKNERYLWALPLTGNDRKPIPVARTAYDAQNGQFSPDGHWVAYETNESGEFQIVVQPFPNPSSKWQVSTSGGTQPRWRADGKALYFLAHGKMTESPIAFENSKLLPGTPVELFPASPVVGLGANRQEYAVSRDGKFLIDQAAESPSTSPITLILNWKPKH